MQREDFVFLQIFFSKKIVWAQLILLLALAQEMVALAVVARAQVFGKVCVRLESFVLLEVGWESRAAQGKMGMRPVAERK